MKYLRLSRQERSLLLEAVLLIFLLKGLLPFFSFRALRNWGHGRATMLALQDLEDSSMVTYIAVAIRRANRLVFWKRSACLINALAAQWMLSRRGISSVLHLGVAKTELGLSAHAWLEVKGHVVVGGDTRDDFAKIASF